MVLRNLQEIKEHSVRKCNFSLLGNIAIVIMPYDFRRYFQEISVDNLYFRHEVPFVFDF